MIQAERFVAALWLVGIRTDGHRYLEHLTGCFSLTPLMRFFTVGAEEYELLSGAFATEKGRVTVSHFYDEDVVRVEIRSFDKAATAPNLSIVATFKENGDIVGCGCGTTARYSYRYSR
ncbi:MAG: hypothetical protein Q7S15_01570 [bacterium]|nr:hypothetical protein [bacterium]